MTEIPQIAGEFARYGTYGFIYDFSYNKTNNKRALKAFENESWLDHNTRAIVITFTLKSSYSNAFYVPTIIIETLGNNVFESRYKLQTIYLTFGTTDEQSEQADILSILVDGLLITNICVFAAKFIAELSVSMNKATNLIEACNLTLLLFAIFIGFTLRGQSFVKHYQQFSEINQRGFVSYHTVAQLRQFELLFLGAASFFYPFRVFQLFAHFKFFY